MTDERELRPDAEPPKESSGEYLWRVLKPAGCIFVLLMMVMFLVFCFTYRHDPGLDTQPGDAVETAETAQTAQTQ